MSQRYKGAVISATPPTTTGGNSGTAPGIWTMQQQLQAQGAGNWPPQPVYYIEDVFSTYLYTGNGSTQTITNGIDLSGKGGLVWIKRRNGTAASHTLFDTATYTTGQYYLATNLDNGFLNTGVAGMFAVTGSGFSVGNSAGWNGTSSDSYVSWTFRKQPKFFDVVTWTGGPGLVTVPHNLGSAPGFIVVKRTDATSDWIVGTSALNSGFGPYRDTLYLNKTDAASSGAGDINSANSTEFTTYVGSGNWVAYLFAHNAGGFGLTGTDNVISCGSFTTDGSGNATVNLGYEPQWVMIKKSSGADSWRTVDVMRGFTASGNASMLFPNLSNAESTYVGGGLWVNATGFTPAALDASGTYIYIAIRRGPMKTPTSGTSVFAIDTSTSSTAPRWESGWPVDATFQKSRDINDWQLAPRITQNYSLIPNLADSENYSTVYAFDYQNGCFTGLSLSGYIAYMLRRAPSFMDVVCYTGDGATGAGSYRILSHNLSAIPELVIIKPRSSTGNWIVTSAFNSTSYSYGMKLNLTDAQSGAWNPVGTGYFTSTQFTTYIGNLQSETNSSGVTYVAYLFASCPGVSKVGSYTGTGSTQTISCGFAARFVMIKRTDSTGNWWVWDTARGMVAGTDPRLALNLTSTETNANWVYTNASGFQIVTTDATVNASGGSYIYLAIA